MHVTNCMPLSLFANFFPVAGGVWGGGSRPLGVYFPIVGIVRASASSGHASLEVMLRTKVYCIGDEICVHILVWAGGG